LGKLQRDVFDPGIFTFIVDLKWKIPLSASIKTLSNLFSGTARMPQTDSRVVAMSPGTAHSRFGLSIIDEIWSIDDL
jgi:hypothetical protein